MFAMILGYAVPDFPGSQWVSPVLGTVMYFWGGRPFLTGAISEIRSRAPGMMLLIGLAITVAFIASWGASLGVLHAQPRLLVGAGAADRDHAAGPLDRDAVAGADHIGAGLAGGAAARRGRAGRPATHVDTVAPSELRVGDVVIVRPGGSVPADGEIVDGAAEMDESMVTGESRPVRRGVGDAVVAGTVATDSGLRVKVTAVGDDTALAGIQRLVTEAQNSSSRAQRLADRAAGWLFWFALGAARRHRVVWGFLGQPDEAVIRTITVLVIACPHALGLAIPLVVSIATERAARGGVLVKDRLALESMRTVGAVLFDKTGTLTKGEPTVTAVAAAGGRTEDEVLALAAAAESDSEHPLARAIVDAARRRELTVPASSDFASSPAVGVTARVDGMTVRVGGPRLLEEAGHAELPEAEPGATRARSCCTCSWSGRSGASQARWRWPTRCAPESRQAVDALHKLGIQVVMITGDAETGGANRSPRARHRPGVRRRAARGQGRQGGASCRTRASRSRWSATASTTRPALAQADVGIAIGAGTDVAIASAGVILASSDPRSVLSVIQLSKAAYRKMKQNLWWAAGYNLISVPLAAGVLAPIGLRDADVGRCDLDVGLDGGGGAERPAAAAPGFAPRGQRPGHSLRI